jgi:hypothetical protein
MMSEVGLWGWSRRGWALVGLWLLVLAALAAVAGR